MNAVILPEHLTDAEIDDIMLSYDHSYGLTISEEMRQECPIISGYTEMERVLVCDQVRELYRIMKEALQKNYAMKLSAEEIIDYNRNLIAKNLNKEAKMTPAQAARQVKIDRLKDQIENLKRTVDDYYY